MGLIITVIGTRLRLEGRTVGSAITTLPRTPVKALPG